MIVAVLYKTVVSCRIHGSFSNKVEIVELERPRRTTDHLLSDAESSLRDMRHG